MTATEIAQLETRKAVVLAELAAMTSTSAGGKPDYSADGQSVSHTAYRKSLYDELDDIDERLSRAEGPIEEVTQGY